jgi:hypothetical protein
VWAVKNPISVVSANRVVANGCMEGSVEVSVAGQIRDRRNSDLCDSETQDNTDMSEVGGRNENIRLTFTGRKLHLL